MQGALYFPLIEVPESAWFTRTLLYWDDVGTIVPSAWVSNPDRLGNYTFDLVRNELVHQVFTYQADPMMATLFEYWLKQMDPAEVSRRRQNFSAGNITPIHGDKWVPWRSGLYTTVDMGLARPRSHAWEMDWIDVESTTANDFMAALALALCHPRCEFCQEMSPVVWIPTTDRSNAFSALLNGLVAISPDSLRERDLRLRVRGEIKASQLRTSILERALPTPAEPLVQKRYCSFGAAMEASCQRVDDILRN